MDRHEVTDLPPRRSGRGGPGRAHEGTEIQVWHANAKGIYSGRDVSTFGDPDAMRGLACRGRQLTERDGVATFLTVYPGWYGGRCICA